MVRSVLQWLADNKEWVFSGAGVVVVGAVWRRLSRRAPLAGEPLPATQLVQGAGNILAGRDVNITLAHGKGPGTPIRDVIAELEPTMGDLLGVLRTALGQNPLIREFFVLPTRSVMLGGSSVPRFRFNADEVSDLMNKVQILEGHGFLRDVTRKTAPVFRMTEDFVALLVRARAVPE